MVLYRSDNRIHIRAVNADPVFAGQRVNDGLWHSVSLSTRGLQIIMTLDNEPASSMQLEDFLEPRDSYYFGGKRKHGAFFLPLNWLYITDEIKRSR